jgi:hypothetical protein
MIHDIRRPACPHCGNDHLVHVTVFQNGEPDGRKAFCAGQRGCHAWWNVEAWKPEPAAGPPLLVP